jgi:hypothetical protein
MTPAAVELSGQEAESFSCDLPCAYRRGSAERTTASTDAIVLGTQQSARPRCEDWASRLPIDWLRRWEEAWR